MHVELMCSINSRSTYASNRVAIRVQTVNSAQLRFKGIQAGSDMFKQKNLSTQKGKHSCPINMYIVLYI